jgi:hypothetical protein
VRNRVEDRVELSEERVAVDRLYGGPLVLREERTDDGDRRG